MKRHAFETALFALAALPLHPQQAAPTPPPQSAPVAAVQAVPAANAAVAPPLSGLLISYVYWPTQYVQFVTGAELPYAMFELDVDDTGKKPIYHAVLTGKDGTRTHYSNVEQVAAAYKRTGEASYQTEIAFEGAENQSVGAVSTMRFSMNDGKPLEFRFVQGSEVGDQGSGLTPLPQAPIAIFAYREQGAVAGEGTALKVGDVVSAAEVWTEISRPPYFVGYRGGLTQSAHQVIFPKSSEAWKVIKSPNALNAGATWELDAENGNHLSLKIEKVDGAHFTISNKDVFHPATNTQVQATRTAEGWSVEQVRLSPVKDGDKHFVVLQFTPGLGTPASTATLTVGKKAKIATAAVAVSGSVADRTVTLTFNSPKWIDGKSVTEETVTTADTVTVNAK